MDLRETLRAAIELEARPLPPKYDYLGKPSYCVQGRMDLDLPALLAALDELDALKIENAETDALNTKLSRILTDTAHALKGTPEALHSHSWADLAQVAAKLVDERNAIKGENARLETERDEYKAREWRVRGGVAPVSPDNCSDCGRAMVWQREDDGESTPGSWMCPNCVMRRCERAQTELAALRVALYPIIIACMTANVHEDAPEIDSADFERAMRLLPECAPCCGSGSKSGAFYEDQPIPDPCEACGGWGIEKPAAPGFLDAKEGGR